MAGFMDDNDDWQKDHEELYGTPDHDAWKREHEALYGRLTPNPQLDLIEEDARREREAEYLIAESAQLMHYYINKPLEEWQPGAEPWLN